MRSGSRGRVCLLTMMMAGAGSSTVRASGPELFGLGAEAQGVAGAMAARGQGASAGYYDPAALVELRGAEIAVGVVGFRSNLSIDRGDGRGVVQPMVEPLALQIGAASVVPLRGWMARRLFVGIALHVVPEEVVRVIARPPAEPQLPFYDNRTQRLVVLPHLALALPWGLSLGVGVDFLAGLQGYVSAREEATRAVEARVDERVVATARAIAGLRWRSSTGRWAAALVYRGEFGVPFSTVTESVVAGQPLSIGVEAAGLYSPRQLVLGSAGRVLPWLLLSLDVTWSAWSGWSGPWVQVTSELPLVGRLSSPPPRPAFRDTASIRLGAEATVFEDRVASLRLRAGWGFESAMAPVEAPPGTALLDGNKHLVAAGLGLRFPIGGGGGGGGGRAGSALRVDGAGQLQIMESAAVGMVKGGGTVLAASLTLAVER